MQHWLIRVAESEGKLIESLEYVLCSDDYLLDLNAKYLYHNTLTDIITFPYSNDPINAEIYMSLDRISDNAQTYANGNVLDELHRVIVHGLLHMCGYNDLTEQMKMNMRALESKYLQELGSFID